MSHSGCLSLCVPELSNGNFSNNFQQNKLSIEGNGNVPIYLILLLINCQIRLPLNIMDLMTFNSFPENDFKRSVEKFHRQLKSEFRVLLKAENVSLLAFVEELAC